MAKDKLRIGIIGTGGIAHAHANAYKNFDDVEVSAGRTSFPARQENSLTDSAERCGWI